MNRNNRVLLKGVALVAAGLIGALVMLAITNGNKPPRGENGRDGTKPPSAGRRSDFESIPGNSTGTIDPPLVSAGKARMRDDEPVIGLIRNDQALAIRKSSMAAYSGHIQHFSTFGGKRLTVIHCSRSNCTRQLVDSGELRVVGFDHGAGEMIVELEGQRHRLSELGVDQHEEMSWGQWRELHPETMVMDLDGPNLERFSNRQREQQEKKPMPPDGSVP